jgi:hypothetical protein
MTTMSQPERNGIVAATESWQRRFNIFDIDLLETCDLSSRPKGATPHSP